MIEVRYTAWQWGSWLLAEARWQRDQERASRQAWAAEAVRLDQELKAARLRNRPATADPKALLNVAAIEALQRGHDARADRFVAAFVDHRDGVCPASGECAAERDARDALSEYGIEVTRG